jgi:hypothetical protein
MMSMCIPWKKMKKDEKEEYIKNKMIKGLAILIFGLVWNYFASLYFDVWRALPTTLAVMGILLILYAFYKRSLI